MADNPRVMVPVLCKRHQRFTVERLELGPSGPWQSALVVTALLLFRSAVARDDVADRCLKGPDGKASIEDLGRVLNEIGCLACFDPIAFDQAIRTIVDRGLQAAAQISMGKEPTDA